MRRRKWLHNVDDPSANPVYEVREVPVRIQAHGLGVDVVPIEVLVGEAPAGTAGEDYQWVPLVRCGVPVALSDLHNGFVEMTPGYYRVDTSQLTNPADVHIEAVYDSASNDAKAMVLIEAGQLCCQRTEPPAQPAPAPGPGPVGPNNETVPVETL